MTPRHFTREATVFRALSHPKRLEILDVLARRRLTATDIQRMTGFPQANLSQHLRELKDARVIVADRQGKHIIYRLTHPDFARLTRMLQELRTPKKARRHETKKTEVQDPVCRMWVEPVSARWQSLYKGATYYFCASGCHRHFSHQPERYV